MSNNEKDIEKGIKFDDFNFNNCLVFDLPHEKYNSLQKFRNSYNKSIFENKRNAIKKTFLNETPPKKETPQSKRTKDLGRFKHNLILENLEVAIENYLPLPNEEEYNEEVFDEWKKNYSSNEIVANMKYHEKISTIKSRLTRAKQNYISFSDFTDIYKIYLSIFPIDENGEFIENESSKFFTGGYPEVSVFFSHKGVDCMTRYDYLKHDSIGDLKTTTKELQNSEYGDSFDDYYIEYGMNFQDIFYSFSWSKLQKENFKLYRYESGFIYEATEEQKDFIKKCDEIMELEFFIIDTDGVHMILTRPTEYKAGTEQTISKNIEIFKEAQKTKTIGEMFLGKREVLPQNVKPYRIVNQLSSLILGE